VSDSCFAEDSQIENHFGPLRWLFPFKISHLSMAPIVLKLRPRAGRLKQMIYPTMSVLTSGAVLVAMLLVADWYVWQLAATLKSRQSHPDNGRGMGAVDGESATITAATCDSAHADRQGFKKVA
jgi:hypothetical protein